MKLKLVDYLTLIVGEFKLRNRLKRKTKEDSNIFSSCFVHVKCSTTTSNCQK